MATTEKNTRQYDRQPLSRERVLEAALQLIDERGLEALTMRSLGKRLGVEAMALYNHVSGKAELFDGLVELLWREVEENVGAARDWRESLQVLARALRAVLHQHPRAAALIASCQVIPVPALRLFDAQLRAIRATGCPADRAAEMLRTAICFAIGYTITEITCFGQLRAVEGESALGRLRRISSMLPADTPDPLVEVALAVCDPDTDNDMQFETGLRTLIRGFEADIGHEELQ